MSTSTDNTKIIMENNVIFLLRDRREVVVHGAETQVILELLYFKPFPSKHFIHGTAIKSFTQRNCGACRKKFNTMTCFCSFLFWLTRIVTCYVELLIKLCSDDDDDANETGYNILCNWLTLTLALISLVPSHFFC